MAKRRVKIGKFKTVFRGRVSNVLQARVVLPSGKRTIFERITRPASVGILALDENGKILLNREFRHRHKKYVWGIPGGRIDTGEAPRAAAQRELREEAGVRARRLLLFDFKDTSQTLEWKRYAYLATGLTPAPLPHDDGEDITIVRVPLKKAAQMALAGKFNSHQIAFLILRLFAKKTGFRI